MCPAPSSNDHHSTPFPLLGPRCPNNRIVRNSSDKRAQQFVGTCTIGHRRGLKWCVQFRTPGKVRGAVAQGLRHYCGLIGCRPQKGPWTSPHPPFLGFLLQRVSNLYKRKLRNELPCPPVSAVMNSWPVLFHCRLIHLSPILYCFEANFRHPMISSVTFQCVSLKVKNS